MARNLFEHHPTLGYRFIPGLRARVRHEGGGYLVRCNQLGFRCDHEGTRRPPAGRFRVLLFGDSYTAGEGVSNRFRFGDLLEQRHPRLEVLNFGLPGSGTDQQYLAFRELARELEYDLLLLCPMYENVRRNLESHRLTQSAADGRLVWRAKPYFELEGERLVLRHHPVPKEVAEAAPAALREDASPAARRARRARRALRAAGARLDRILPGARGWSRRVRRVAWPPDYEDPGSRGWRMMRAILTTWVRESRAEVLLAPIPTFEHVRGELRGEGPRRRFAELGRELGVECVDVLAALRRHPGPVRRSARFPGDDHPTRLGHRLLADALEPALARRLAAGERAA